MSIVRLKAPESILFEAHDWALANLPRDAWQSPLDYNASWQGYRRERDGKPDRYVNILLFDFFSVPAHVFFKLRWADYLDDT